MHFTAILRIRKIFELPPLAPYNRLMKERVYLDYNATAPVRQAAKAAAMSAMEDAHNASSVHSFGREARSMVEKAREAVAALVNTPPAQVIFNSGATEGNNTVLKHFAHEKVLVSAIEHPAVLEAHSNAIKIPVTKDGIVDLTALEELLRSPPESPPQAGGSGGEKKPALVSVMMVNNETGVIQPIKEISALAHKYGALFHSDAVQAAGRIPLDIAELGIDFLTLSSHKIGGPQGAGALVMGLCGITPVLLHGGGQEKSARAGTENVPAIAGFGAAAQEALEWINRHPDRAPGNDPGRAEGSHATLSDPSTTALRASAQDDKKAGLSPTQLRELQTSLEKKLCKINEAIIIHGQNADRVPNTTMFSLPGASSETLMMALDLEGIAVSNGSACSSGTVKSSYVIKAMGYGDDIASSALRISTGWNSKETDIDRFLEAFAKIVNRIKTKKAV